MQKILVIIPTYNEEQTIIPLIDGLFDLKYGIDILVVDDGYDKTPQLIKNHHAYNSKLFLIKRTKKSGRGTAVIQGIKYGLSKDYELIAEMDADFSHHPQDFIAMLAKAGEDNVVIGSRYIKGGVIKNWPLTRKMFSKFANLYASFVLNIGIHDYTDGYRIYGRSALEKIDLDKIEAKGYIVLSEIAYMLYKKGVKFIEVPITFVNRDRGVSSFSFKEIKEAFTAVWKIKKINGKT
ncbi:MAG: polyprenol monophosphomannose synthase [Candidatus Kuenenbacteria bacterium]